MILVGHVIDELQRLPDRSVHCCVTSPPYWGLRAYGTDPQTWYEGWRGELGAEPTPQMYARHLSWVFGQVWRVLRDDGTLWLNLGDCYAYQPGKRKAGDKTGRKQATNRGSIAVGSRTASGLKPKDLAGIPWRVAFALQDHEWFLRSEIIWQKPNGMCESVEDRPTKMHETIFLFAKQPQYFFDAENVREPSKSLDPTQSSYRPNSVAIAEQGRKEFSAKHEMSARSYNPAGRNIRSVWTITTEPLKDAHFAVFPKELPERCIKAGTSDKGCCPECGAPWKRVLVKQRLGKKEYAGKYAADQKSNGRNVLASVRAARLAGGHHDNPFPPAITVGWKPSCKHDHEPVPCTVLDPFLGSGTTGLVAEALGRNWIGIELNPDFAEIARKRIARGYDSEPAIDPAPNQRVLFA